MNNQEYVLTQDDIIILIIDVNGIITYVSDDLVRIAGFSREELIGAQHDIFRYPDILQEVFADFWNTIPHNYVWNGAIKNKTKDGGFYWLFANISPIYENKIVVGYVMHNF